MAKKQIFQWYIATVIGGKEKTICEEIIDRLKTYENYGPDKAVRKIVVLETQKTDVKILDKDSPFLPKNLNNTATTSWKVLPNGKYQKTSLSVTNKYPGYIFIYMAYDENIWYVIRNTPGVLGFLGSTKLNSKPTPISPIKFGLLEQNAYKSPVKQAERAFLPKSSILVKHGNFKGMNGLFISYINDEQAKIELRINDHDKIVEVNVSDLVPYSPLAFSPTPTPVPVQPEPQPEPEVVAQEESVENSVEQTSTVQEETAAVVNEEVQSASETTQDEQSTEGNADVPSSDDQSNNGNN